MKRYGNLWPDLISFENLLQAANKACKGKRFRPGVARFHFYLEPNLWKLHDELAERSYAPGAYRTFTIYEPKKRLISAAPYRDRVVHHAFLVKDNIRRFRRRVRQMQREYANREISPDDVRRRLMSWAVHAKQADTYRLLHVLFGKMCFRRATADKPCVAGRVVQ